MTIVSMFFIVLIAAFAALAFFTEPSKSDKRINARLVSLDRKLVPGTAEESGIVREIIFSKIPVLDRFLRRNRAAIALQLSFEQAGLQWTVGRFVFATLLAILIGAVLGNWWIAPGLLGWAPSLALGTAPYIFLAQKRKMRFRQFSAALPEAIDLMSRSLRAGQALPATLEIVAQEAQDPLKSEFRRVADEQSFGLPFREAMLNLNSRVHVPDLQFLVTAILVQKETGGNLAVILDKASHIIRERIRVEGEARIRSAQGRLTGWILCALPFAIFIIMNMMNPGYGKILFEDPLGQKMVGLAAVMMIIGMVLIRRIVAIKI